MSVDLRNYVQVNINYNKKKPLNRSRDTVAIITVSEDISNHLDTHTPEGATEAVDYYVSLADYVAAIAAWNEAHPDDQIIDTAENPILYKYAQCYFANGGLKLKIVGGFSEDESAGAPSLDEQEAAFILSKALLLPAEVIVITSDAAESVLEEVARSSSTTNLIYNPVTDTSSVQTLTGYKEKIYISSTVNAGLVIASPDKIPNFAIKFGQPGIEMAAAAYLSQASIGLPRSISDYCYTIEDVSMFLNAVQDDNDTVVSLVTKNFNLDTTLVNNVRNINGDTVSGNDLMNYYVRIILVQTLTDAIVNVLVSKIKMDKSGINRVANAITQELNVYKSNGFLDSDYIWTDDDLYYTFNGVDYLVCSRNTPFKMGYKFIILPVSSLTKEQRDAHAFPPVYVVIADSTSVRQIVINGDAF